MFSLVLDTVGWATEPPVIHSFFVDTVNPHIEAPSFYQYKWIRPPPGARRLSGARLLSQRVNFVLPVFYSNSTSVYQYQYFVYFHDVLKVDAEDKIKLLNSWLVANKLSLSLDKTCYGRPM